MILRCARTCHSSSSKPRASGDDPRKDGAGVTSDQ